MNWFQTVTRESGWKMTELGDGYAKGTIDTLSSGHVVWSVPADDGWTVTIDGQKTRTFSAYKAFLGIHIPAGTHEITIRYTPAGYRTGVFVTCGSVLLMVFLSVTFIIPKKSRKKKEDPEEKKESGEKETEV